MNGVMTSVTAFDFDGILCHDAESDGEPLGRSICRGASRSPSLLGRQEREREATLAWLQKWNVRVASLTMMADENVLQIAEYKVQVVTATTCM